MARNSRASCAAVAFFLLARHDRSWKTYKIKQREPTYAMRVCFATDFSKKCNNKNSLCQRLMCAWQLWHDGVARGVGSVELHPRVSDEHVHRPLGLDDTQRYEGDAVVAGPIVRVDLVVSRDVLLAIAFVKERVRLRRLPEAERLVAKHSPAFLELVQGWTHEAHRPYAGQRESIPDVICCAPGRVIIGVIWLQILDSAIGRDPVRESLEPWRLFGLVAHEGPEEDEALRIIACVQVCAIGQVRHHAVGHTRAAERPRYASGDLEIQRNDLRGASFFLLDR